ncbi:hypothetical protein CPB85DRAFT_1554794 [Mucidula mucida]|nr:hypothetical protein CPB85DRAFT_1554794 [Mucidula mucida]
MPTKPKNLPTKSCPHCHLQTCLGEMIAVGPDDGGQDEGDDDWDGLGDPSAPIRDDGGKAKDDEVHERHPYINDGEFLPRGAPPPPSSHDPKILHVPQMTFGRLKTESRSTRRSALFEDAGTPVHIDTLMQIWLLCMISRRTRIAKDLNTTIDASSLVLLNQLRNPDFKDEMDFSAKRMFDKSNRCSYKDFMSGNWAWRLSDDLAKDAKYYGTTLCSVILGSDKTTVSVATGQNNYYPLYLSNGLIHNNVRPAHRNGVTLIGFLAIPKGDREATDSVEFRRFKRELFHASLREILEPLRAGMTDPEVVLYATGTIDQVQLACIVQGWCARCTANKNDLDGLAGRRSHAHTLAVFEAQTPKQMWDQYGIINDIMPFTHYFPRADIHELLSPDLLHQIIKGPSRIISIAAVLPFPELRRFPEGRGFKRWTGNDSKALMKVYLPAIAGLIPDKMVRALSTFMEFCYLVRCSVITEDVLKDIDTAVAQFHEERKVFEELGVRPDAISLPRQHSMVHYRHLIQEFGAPNGLCSSITESKHIKAVKDPYRRTSKYEALEQMLDVNQRMDKLAAMRVDFCSRGMLAGSIFDDVAPPPPPPDPVSKSVSGPDKDDDDDGAVDTGDLLSEVVMAAKPITGLPRNVHALAHTLRLPQLPELTRCFLYQQESLMDDNVPMEDPMLVDLDDCPPFSGPIRVFPSAVVTFFSPSGESGRHGMYHERIRSVGSWCHGPPRRDCIFLDKDSSLPGFRGLHAARVLLFFSMKHMNIVYPCALITWFSPIGDEPDPVTGMWMVEPDVDENGERVQAVVHLDTIVRAAHLIGISGDEFTPRTFKHSDSLDFFNAFYVNKYIDYHAHEIAF